MIILESVKMSLLRSLAPEHRKWVKSQFKFLLSPTSLRAVVIFDCFFLWRACYGAVEPNQISSICMSVMETAEQYTVKKKNQYNEEGPALKLKLPQPLYLSRGSSVRCNGTNWKRTAIFHYVNSKMEEPSLQKK